LKTVASGGLLSLVISGRTFFSIRGGDAKVCAWILRLDELLRCIVGLQRYPSTMENKAPDFRLFFILRAVENGTEGEKAANEFILQVRDMLTKTVSCFRGRYAVLVVSL